MVRKIGLSGRFGCSACKPGRLTWTSTVASGAAIMKMISSTRMTSMNGVTLISWMSSSSSLPWSRRTLMQLLRRQPGGHEWTAPALRCLDALRRLRDFAAGEVEHFGAGVGEQRLAAGDRAGEIVVDHHRRDGCGET